MKADANAGDPGESAELKKLCQENEILSSLVDFFRLKARLDTALMVAFMEAYRTHFSVEPSLTHIENYAG